MDAFDSGLRKPDTMAAGLTIHDFYPVSEVGRVPAPKKNNIHAGPGIEVSEKDGAYYYSLTNSTDAPFYSTEATLRGLSNARRYIASMVRQKESELERKYDVTFTAAAQNCIRQTMADGTAGNWIKSRT